jgi:hypothetical protein
MKTSLAFLAVCASFALSACDNPDQTANGLFVEASQAVAQAVIETDAITKHDLLVKADAAVTRVTTEFQGTNAAVRIAANEKLGPYTNTELKAALQQIKASPELCLRQISSSCMTEVVSSALRYVVTADRNTEADPVQIALAFTGWPYLVATAPATAETILQSSPERNELIAILAHGSLNLNAPLPTLIALIYEAKGETAAVAFVAKLAASPFYKPYLGAQAADIANALIKDPTPERAKAARTVVQAISNPLPNDILQKVDITLCGLGHTDAKRATVAATCSPQQILAINNDFYGLPPDAYIRLHEAASTAEKKLAVAKSAYNMPKADIVSWTTWYEAAGYNQDPDHLVRLYIQASQYGHPARQRFASQLKAAQEAFPNDILTQNGISDRNLALIHAQGTLHEQLPAIYQHILNNRGFSLNLERILKTLLLLEPVTNDMDYPKLVSVIGDVVHSWPKKHGANRDYFNSVVHTRVSKDYPDPKPMLDRYYNGQPYHLNLSASELRTFKKNGHTAIYDAAIAASKPITEIHSTLFQVLQQEVFEAVKAGDISTVNATLDAQDRMVRYIFVRNILADGNLGAGFEIPEKVRTALIQKYTYDAVANELGWSRNLGVPFDLKKQTVFTNYTTLKEFNVNPDRWLMSSFAALSHDDRVTALRLLRDNNEEKWPIYATAIAALEHVP